MTSRAITCRSLAPGQFPFKPGPEWGLTPFPGRARKGSDPRRAGLACPAGSGDDTEESEGPHARAHDGSAAEVRPSELRLPGARRHEVPAATTAGRRRRPNCTATACTRTAATSAVPRASLRPLLLPAGPSPPSLIVCPRPGWASWYAPAAERPDDRGQQRRQTLRPGHGANGATFQIAEAQLTTILGPSGCGKSTMLRCLNRLERFDAGRITIDDVEIARQRRRPLSPPTKTRWSTGCGPASAWCSRTSTCSRI